MAMSEAKKKAVERYHSKFDSVQFRIPKGMKGKILQHAAIRGESMTQFILRAIRNQMERDKQDK